MWSKAYCLVEEHDIMKTIRLDLQPFSAPAFLRAHHGWITGLPFCIFDQSDLPARIVQASR